MPTIKNSEFCGYSDGHGQGFIKDLDKVLTTPVINAKLNEIVDFYNDISFRLQEIKRNNADMYFLNGDM